MLCKGAIIPIDNEPDQFISYLFIVPNPNGKFRPVINLKKLNMFVRQEHFKQEIFSVVLDLVQEKDYNIIREHNKIPADQTLYGFFEEYNNKIKEHNKIPADQSTHAFFEENNNNIPADQSTHAFFEEHNNICDSVLFSYKRLIGILVISLDENCTISEN